MKSRNPLILKADINRIYDEKIARTRTKNRRNTKGSMPRNNRQNLSRGKIVVRRKKRNKIFDIGMGLDLPFLLTILVLITIGTIMMFSASYPTAYYEVGDSYYYLKRQIVFAVAGIILMILISFFNYRKLHALAVPILIVSYISLTVVLLLPSETNIKRWINIGSFGIQPSEIAKFAIILFLAHWGSKYYNKMQTFKYGALPGALVFSTTAVLLYLEPHYSCIVICAVLTLIMMYISGIEVKWIVGAGVIIGIVAVIAAQTGALTYAMNRMDGWGQALNYTADNKWDTWQTRNSLYAIGSGGFWGLGLGQSRQKFLYLPEPHNDFIFSIVCEELGLIGAIIILLIFAILVWRGITLSLRASDRFGKLLGVGLTAQIAIQVIMNIFVITDWLPNTGISFPFFSSGGSALLMILMQMGIVLSISRTADIEGRKAQTEKNKSKTVKNSKVSS